jgi:predicted nucleic acid-binding protein
LELLREVAEKICISEQVHSELLSQSGTPEETLELVQDGGFVVVQKALDTSYLNELHQRYGVGLGERSTLVVVKQLNAEDALLANNGAEAMFASEGVPFTNLYDFVQFCQTEGVISKTEYDNVVSGLYRPEKKSGYRPKKHRKLFIELGLEKEA